MNNDDNAHGAEMLTNLEILNIANAACSDLYSNERDRVTPEDPQPANDGADHPGIAIRMVIDGTFKYLHVRRMLQTSEIRVMSEEMVETVVPPRAEVELRCAIQRIVRKHLHKTQG